jgi:hypothetical protein
MHPNWKISKNRKLDLPYPLGANANFELSVFLINTSWLGFSTVKVHPFAGIVKSNPDTLAKISTHLFLTLCVVHPTKEHNISLSENDLLLLSPILVSVFCLFSYISGNGICPLHAPYICVFGGNFKNGPSSC